MPGIFPVLGGTEAEAQEQLRVHPVAGASHDRLVDPQAVLRRRRPLGAIRPRRQGAAAADAYRAQPEPAEARLRSRSARADAAPALSVARHRARPSHRGRDARAGRRRDRRVVHSTARRTASTSCRRSCRPGSPTSSIRWCRSCRSAACSAPSTRARRCAKTSASSGRPTGSSLAPRAAEPEERLMGKAFNIVGFAGSSSRPSRTRNLVEAITTTAAERIGAQGHDLRSQRNPPFAGRDARSASRAARPRRADRGDHQCRRADRRVAGLQGHLYRALQAPLRSDRTEGAQGQAGGAVGDRRQRAACARARPRAAAALRVLLGRHRRHRRLRDRGRFHRLPAAAARRSSAASTASPTS